MWKKIYDLARWIFNFGDQTRKNQENIEILQEDARQMATLLRQVIFELQRMRDEIRHLKEGEQHERDKLLLRLENELLKAERRLPPEIKKEEGGS